MRPEDIMRDKIVREFFNNLPEATWWGHPLTKEMLLEAIDKEMETLKKEREEIERM